MAKMTEKQDRKEKKMAETVVETLEVSKKLENRILLSLCSVSLQLSSLIYSSLTLCNFTVF